MPSRGAPALGLCRAPVRLYLEAIGRLIRPQHQAARVFEGVDVAVLHDEVAEVQRLCGVGLRAEWRLGSPSCPRGAGCLRQGTHPPRRCRTSG